MLITSFRPAAYAYAKHWFQDDKPGGAGKFKPKSSIVLVLFRDPFDWVDAMREVSWLIYVHG